MLLPIRRYATSLGAILLKSAHSSKVLRHLHFTDITDYETGLQIQETFVRANLDFKKIQTKIQKQLAEINAGNVEVEVDGEKGIALVSEYEQNLLAKMVQDIKPNPVLLTFQFRPVFTGGKREKYGLDFEKYSFKGARYVQSLRGGQVTYHGPGQMVAYLVLDLADFTRGEQVSSDKLKSSGKKTLSARCFVNALEESIIKTLNSGTCYTNIRSRQPFGIPAIRTENTGVWINETEKIASIGVHVRRGITSHGVAVNVSTDLTYPNRFVMCGLKEARTTSMEEYWRKHGSDRTIELKDVCYSYAKSFAQTFGFSQVEHFDLKSSQLTSKEILESAQPALKNGVKEYV